MLADVFGGVERTIKCCQGSSGIALPGSSFRRLELMADAGKVEQHFKVLAIELGDGSVDCQVIAIELNPNLVFVKQVEQFIVLEKRYGREKVEKAAAIIMLKAIDNPLRSFGYFVGTILSLP